MFKSNAFNGFGVFCYKVINNVFYFLNFVTTENNTNDENKILKFNSEDSGIDIHCCDDRIEIPPMGKVTINLGIKCQLKNNDKNTAFWLMPRSSISKTPLIMCNSMGLIDSGYRGELKAPIYNTSSETFVIEKYTRLFHNINFN